VKLVRRHRLVALILGLALVAAACGDDEPVEEGGGDGGGGAITVGSADFAESSIVAEMYALILEDRGYDVSLEPGIGSREVYFAALENGEIDVVPEFAGTLLSFLEGEPSGDTDETVSKLRDALPEGLAALEPAAAQSANVFVVTRETADEHGLETVSDLAGMSDMVLGGPPECPQRPYCIPGLRDTYGVDFSDSFRALDAGGPITRQALESGEVDVALLFSTDGAIPENGWVILEDDEGLQPAENVLPVVRDEVVDPEAREALDAVSAELDQETYVDLVTRVNVDDEDPEDVAREFLEEHDLL
jgi:osmoprotectant transport system substrate-binding protein